jgi:hypothetical protein
MNFLGKLFGDLNPRLETPDDDPEARRMREAQKKDDWRTVQAFFSQLKNPDDREFYVAKLSNWKRRLDFFDIWVKASPKCSDAWLLRGAHGIHWAWEARTGAQADYVAEEAWAIFFERLKGAWNDLSTALDLNPADPTPYGQLIPCAMGLQLEKEVVFTCLNNSVSHSLLSWQAHSATLWYLCEKWHGSHDEMFDFARSVSASAPEGSGLHALIPIAHHERWLYAIGFDQDAEFADKYYNQPEVQRQIIDAYNKSLGSRTYKSTKLTRDQSSFFAVGLLRSQAFKQALFELERLDNRVPEYPWAQLGDPVDRYTRALNIARANIGKN